MTEDKKLLILKKRVRDGASLTILKVYHLMSSLRNEGLEIILELRWYRGSHFRP